MLNVRMVAFAFVAVVVAGCATRESQRSLYEHRSSAALAHYSAGSSVTGDGRSLLLFADGHWELWRLTCTEQWLSEFGSYQKTGNTYTLTQKKKPAETLYLFRDAPHEYLLTKEERRAGVDGENTQDLYKLVQPNP